MGSERADWSEHQHEAGSHGHPHHHVTHNYNERVGGFEHLSYQHEHEHEHQAELHTHFPHQDFEQEHLGEAHHGHPPARGAGSAAEELVAPVATAAKAAKKVTKKVTKKVASPRKRATAESEG